MIKRYTPIRIGKIWSDENKYQNWLKTELAVLRAREKMGLVSPETVKNIEKNAKFTVERIEELDKQIEHDMNAFIMAIQENLDPRSSGEFHKPLTSYDIEEPALALMMMESLDIIIEDLNILMKEILERSKEHKYTIMAGRTHGQIAEPTTFGLLLLAWHQSLENDLNRLGQAKEVISYGKISGAVGTYSGTNPEIEKLALAELNLKPAKISTQILSRDRIAQLMAALAILAANLEKIFQDIRILSRSEIKEVREPFKKGQKGSSRMPHKKNPVISERICGLSRAVRGFLVPAIENIATWEQRDITQSSVERIILPDAFALLDYMLTKGTAVIKGLEVFPDKMLENLDNMTYGTTASGLLKDFLLEEGLESEAAYRLIQEWSNQALDKKIHLRQIIKDSLIKEGLFLTTKDAFRLEDCFNYQRQLTAIDEIYKRFDI